MTDDNRSFCGCDKPKFVQQVRGGSLVVTCETCGMEAVTTFTPPEWQDEKIYTIRVLSCDNEKQALIRFLATEEGLSTAQAKQLVEHRDPVFEHTGSSPEILEFAKRLADQQIGYRCSPRYPHFIQYQIVSIEQAHSD